MKHNLALPMYDLHRADTSALLATLRALLVARGIPAGSLTTSYPQEALLTHWQQDSLLLSQTCGFPLVTQLPQVQVVGAFHYSAPGCEEYCYRSLLVARRADRHKTLADFRGHRVVCNAPDSQSGYNVLLGMVAPLARNGRFFGAVRFSGSHQASLVVLNQHTADIAAIDCVSWALLQRHHPGLTQGLSVVGESPLAPGLPLITAQSTSSHRLSLLRDALSELACHRASVPLLISGFSVQKREEYSRLLDWRNDAAALGVTCL